MWWCEGGDRGAGIPRPPAGPCRPGDQPGPRPTLPMGGRDGDAASRSAVVRSFRDKPPTKDVAAPTQGRARPFVPGGGVGGGRPPRPFRLGDQPGPRPAVPTGGRVGDAAHCTAFVRGLRDKPLTTGVAAPAQGRARPFVPGGGVGGGGVLPGRFARATSPGRARPSPWEGAMAMPLAAHPSSGAFGINRRPRAWMRPPRVRRVPSCPAEVSEGGGVLSGPCARATSPGRARPSPREGALAMPRAAQPSSGACGINRRPRAWMRPPRVRRVPSCPAEVSEGVASSRPFRPGGQPTRGAGTTLGAARGVVETEGAGG